MSDVLVLDRRQGERAYDFLGARFDRVDSDVTFRRIVETAQKLEPFRYVVTPNVDHLVRLAREPELTELYAEAWLVVCDSRVVELMGQAQGLRIKAAPGSDLTERLLTEAIDPNDSITIIGGAAHVVAAVKKRFNLTNVHWHDPPMGLRAKPGAIAACAQFVAAHPSKWVLFAVGSPQQEMVAHSVALRGDCVGVGLCVGASLDFLAGAATRAPRWMRAARLEWLHRLASEPGRMWKRYLLDGPRIFGLWLQGLKRQRS
jgi:N-acetylglucosaminyldiphosphoundecaprenol N-acetyl-beta-D-mannosaminyltransferase